MNAFDDADDLDDPELPDRSDMDLDDFTVMSRCPYCKKMIADDSEICPHCGNFISSEDAPRRYPLWIIIGMVLAILGVFTGWILHL